MSTQYSGSGNPAGSLALLWRTTERRSRKGKPELSVDRIVAAAIEHADAAGLGALSMRRVADRLGVGTMSLYTYVPGKAELLDAMVDTVHGETLRPPQQATGSWRERLELIARDNWAMYLRHPWMLQMAASRPVLGPNVTAKYDYELRAVDGIGLTDVEMDSVLSLLSGQVETAARRAVDAARAEEATGMSDAQWWSAYAPLLEGLIDARRFPLASRVGSAAGAAYGSAFDPVRAFEFGLARLLDGIEVLVSSR